MTSLLTKEQLLAKCERRYKDFAIPGGGKVRIRSLKSAEIAGWQASLLDPKTGEPCIKRQKTARERLVAVSVVDENGVPIFGKDDLEALNGLDNAVIGKIAAEVTEFNGIDTEYLEETVGNSNGTPDGT